MAFEKFEVMTHGYTHTHNDQLKDFVYKKQEEMYRMGRAMRDQVKTIEELEAYKAEFRAHMEKQIGGIPFDDTPLNAQITARREYDEYVMESIIFQSRQDTYVTGTMYIPHGISGPSAAVLMVCGHSNNGRLDDNYQMVQLTLVKAGLIVFAVDPFGQGERCDYFDEETGKSYVSGCTGEHDAAGIPGVLNGTFMARYFLCDEMRAIDYMLTRSEIIDPKRIGVTGNSGGGTQTTMMMMMDERIAAAAPGTFFTSREAYMYSGQAQDCEQIWPDFTSKGYEHVTALMTMAPRPACILATKYDFFPIEGTREAVEEGKRFYEMYGKGDALRLAEDEFTHCYTPALARAAASFFSEVLLGEEHPVTDNEHFPIKPEEEMYATKTGQVKTSIPGAVFVHDDNVRVAEELREARLALPKEERLARAEEFLKDVVYRDRIPAPFNARIFPRMHCMCVDGYLATSFSWFSQKRLFNFGLLIRPEEYEHDMCRPTVIALWDEGSRRTGAYEEWIRKTCAEGKQVFVLDVTGVGDVKQNPLRIDDTPKYYKAFYGTLYKLDCDLIYSGDSMPAMRVYDVIRCIDMLKHELGLTDDMLSLYCDGVYGVYGIMAAFMYKTIPLIQGPTLLKNAEEAYVKPHFTMYEDHYSLFLPGMLRYFDYDEIL